MNKCNICGEDMPENEQMFMFHGYSGPCPKPPLLQPHQQRVVTEKEELDKKLSKLKSFFDTDIFKRLDSEERVCLHRQAVLMTDYSNVLGERIAAFAK